MHSCKQSVFCKKGGGAPKGILSTRTFLYLWIKLEHYSLGVKQESLTHLNSNLTTHSQVSIGNTSAITFDIYKYLMVNFRSRTTLFYGTRENVYVNRPEVSKR
jgi:hypothetical protein